MVYFLGQIMYSLDSSIVQAKEIKSTLEKDIEQILPNGDGTTLNAIFGRIKSIFESCLSSTPSVRAHQELFMNALFENTLGNSDALALPNTKLDCKEFIRIEDQILRLSDLFLIIDFENKERELNQCLNKVKESVVLPILKSNSQLAAYLQD